jgi:hypothetical protein
MSKLTGTVDKVFEHRKGKSDSGKRWSVQRFVLETDDEKVTCEAWGQRDLEDLEGEEVSVTGKMTKETYEGKTYERFKLDAPPKVGGGRSRDDDDEPRRSKRDDNGDPPPRQDTWKVHLMRAANLLVKCHEAAISQGLEEGEDARTLFIEMKRYIKEMPAKPMTDDDQAQAHVREPEPPPPEPEPEEYQGNTDQDDDIPF